MSRGGPAVEALSGPVFAIVALAAEARTLKGLRGNIEVRISGPGPAAAARATEAALVCRPRLIVSWGVAGALAPNLPPGTLLRPATVLASDDSRLFESAAANVTAGTLVSVAAPVRSRQERLALAKRAGAMAVDMESAAIAAVCQREGIPFQCIRAISDALDHQLPAWVAGLMTPDGRLAPWPALKGLLRDPLALPDLLRAGLGFRRALHSLERYAATFAP